MSFLSADVLAKEVLVVHPPDGWRLNFETDIANIRFLEYFPKGESTRTWTEMITIQVIDNTMGLNPLALANNLRARFVTGCGRKSFVVQSGSTLMVTLLSASMWSVMRSSVIEEPGIREFRRHEVMAFQIIQGRRIFISSNAHGADKRGSRATHLTGAMMFGGGMHFGTTLRFVTRGSDTGLFWPRSSIPRESDDLHVPRGPRPSLWV